MKKLQNNFTTPEQSKRLMEIGVPADSADMRYENDLVGRQNNHVSYSSPDYGAPRKYFEDDVPCWSVGRLIEIYNITTNLMPGMEIELNFEPQNCTYIELVIAAFELAADDGLNDFSRLED